MSDFPPAFQAHPCPACGGGRLVRAGAPARRLYPLMPP
jgi:hypothetical protein